MRYTAKSGDWAEIEGAADTPMSSFDALYESNMDLYYETVRGLVTSGVFGMKAGGNVEVTPESSAAIFRKLSKRQLLWLRDRIMDAMRDEEIDPEA